MKTMRMMLLSSLLLVVACGQGTAEPPAKAGVTELKDFNAKVNYSLGMQIARDFAREGVEVDPPTLLQGMKDQMSGGKTLLTQEEMQQTILELQNKLQAEKQAKMQEDAQKNLEEGQAFFEENLTREGVVALENGLQYEVLQAGEGPSPSLQDEVVVHYRGTLLDGTQFDSSYDRGQPATFTLNRVIRGWQEAIPLMREGAKWKLFIPSELAYGERGAGQVIGPNAALVFEVELLEVHRAEAGGAVDN